MPYNGVADNLQTSPAWPLREDQILRQMRKAALSVRTRTEFARRRSFPTRQTLCPLQGLVTRRQHGTAANQSLKRTARPTVLPIRNNIEPVRDGLRVRELPKAAKGVLLVPRLPGHRDPTTSALPAPPRGESLPDNEAGSAGCSC